jgi:hypothetical protein
MADVYAAVEVASGNPVAVKIVRSSDSALSDRLSREARALALLEHPGLVKLLDAGVHDGQAFLVMELVEGRTLAARMRRGPLTPARCAALGRILANALAYVHAAGIVHRDVKPGNVLLGPGGRARLADFGIARLVDTSSLTLTGTTLGTAAYMAPEQIEHHAVGPPADVWSLGIILVECLSGRRVFEGPAPEVVAHRLTGPLPLPPGLPVPWRLLFEGMLARDPASRLSAGDVGGLLRAAPFSVPWSRPAPDTTTPDDDTVHNEKGQPGTTQRLSGAMPGPAANTVPNGTYPDGTYLDRTYPDGTYPDGTYPAPLPGASAGTTGGVRLGRRRARWPWVVGVAVALAAGAGASAWVLTSQATPHRGTGGTTTTTTPTTTTPTTAPTTTVPSTSDAAAAFVRDVEAGAASGSLRARTRQQLLDDLNQALAAQSNGDKDQAAVSIGAMDATIAHDVQTGQMTTEESATLTSDVATLATSLGVSSSTPSGNGATTSPSGGRGGSGHQGTGNSGASGTGSTGGTGNTGGGP